MSPSRSHANQARAVGIMLILSLLLAACSRGATPPTKQSGDGTEGLFTTGDLEEVVLAADEGPEGLQLNEILSGPRTLLHSVSGNQDRTKKLEEAGFILSWRNRFEVEGGSDGEPNDEGFVFFDSVVTVYKDREGAKEALESSPTPSNAEEFESDSHDGLGEQAVRQEWTQNEAPLLRLLWLRGNAVMNAGVTGSEGQDLDFEALQELANTMDEARPSGAPELDLPGSDEDGKMVFEDDFSDPSSGWDAQDHPEAQSNYQDGSWLMKVAAGSLWNGTDEINEDLAKLQDARVEFDATPTDATGTVEFGAACRASTESGATYILALGTANSLIIARDPGPQSGDPIAIAGSTSAGEGLVAKNKKSRIRAECVGDDIVRLSLYIDGELILDALDDDPLPPASVGMYVQHPENAEGVSEVAFDNLEVTEL